MAVAEGSAEGRILLEHCNLGFLSSLPQPTDADGENDPPKRIGREGRDSNDGAEWEKGG